MNSISLRALVACALLSGTVIAAPVPLTPQKGAAALVTMYQTRDELPRELDRLTYDSSDLVDLTLRLLASATTPAKVTAAAGGVTVACPVAGSVLARLAPRVPRVLKLQWTGCSFLNEGQTTHTLDGVGEVALFDATFTPVAVASISLGDRSGALIDHFAYLGVDTPPDVNSYSLRMTGYIPMARASVNGAFRGSSLHELTGYHEIRSSYLAGDEDQLFESTYTISADQMVVQRTLTDTESSVSVLGGKLTFVWDYPDTPDEPAHTYRYSIEPSALRIRDLTNLTTLQRTFEIDGAVRISMPDFIPFGCNSTTDFTFLTTTPLHYVDPFSGSDLFDAGEILMNGTRATFYPTSGGAAAHVEFDAPPAGFSYDVGADGGWASLLFGPAACRP
jgi:hypothetical protein